MALSVDTTPAKHVTVLRNGDSNYNGRKFIVSRRRYRTFEALLSDITSNIGAPFGAVRRLYTPRGGRRIDNIEELEGGSTYVAGGSERFKKVSYHGDGTGLAKNWGLGSVKRAPGFLADEPPPLVLPKKNRKYAQRSAQFYKVHQPVQFTVFRNGMPQERGFKFLLKPREMREYDTVLSIISMKIRLVEGAVRRLYSVNGMPVIGISDIVDGGSFVACGNRKYIPASYGMLISQQIPKPQKLPIVKRLRQVDDNSGNRTQSNPLPAIQKKPLQESKAKSEKDSPIPVPEEDESDEEEEEEVEVLSRGLYDDTPNDTPRSKLQLNGNDSEEEEISRTTTKKSVRKIKSKAGVSQGTDLLNKRSDKDSVFKGGANDNGAKDGDFLSNVESAHSDQNGVFKPKTRGEEADEVIEDKGLVEEKPIDLQKAEEVEEDLK